MIGRWRQKKKSLERAQKIDVVVLSYGDENALTKTLASIVASSLSFNSTTVVSPPKSLAGDASLSDEVSQSREAGQSNRNASPGSSDFFDMFKRLPESIRDLRGDFVFFLRAGVCLTAKAPERLLETLSPGNIHCLNLEVITDTERYVVSPPENVFSMLSEVYEPWGFVCSRALYREVGELDADFLSIQFLEFFLRVYEKRGNTLATTREALIEVDESDFERGLMESYYLWCAERNAELVEELPGRQAEEQGLYHSLLADLCERHRDFFDSLTNFFVPDLLSKARLIPELRRAVKEQKGKSKELERAYHRVQERRRAAESSYKHSKEKRHEALDAYKRLLASHHALEAEAAELRSRVSELEQEVVLSQRKRLEFCQELSELEARKELLEAKNSKLARKLREDRLAKEPWL